MHKLKLFLSLWFLLAVVGMRAQVTDSIFVEIDTVAAIDTTEAIIIPDNHFHNTKALKPFFEKLILNQQQKTGKINIVHIGDSHIQADLMTNVIRKKLQGEFGNGGRGFIFPYSLAKTNGSYNERFSSNRTWESYRNIYPAIGHPVGLSGIGLWTKAKDFAIEINVKDSSYGFNTIKIITPKNKDMFDVATASKTIVMESSVPKKITHKIKKGEAVSIIAEKYGISVAQLKKANNLKSNNIRAGKTLRIPTNEMQQKSISRSEFIPLDIQSNQLTHYFTSDTPLNKIYLIPEPQASEFALNGLVLENNNPGVIYSSIGVNGAKFSDYNKYPLFFEQLKALQPDMIVLSLGTNETFDKTVSSEYMVQLNLFLENLKAQNINASVLVSTPPPSLFKRKFPNTFAADYSENILKSAEEKGFAVWDLYSQFGGLYGVERNAARGLMSGDRVHYSKAGYEKQGNLLSEAFLKAYNNFKSGTEN